MLTAVEHALWKQPACNSKQDCECVKKFRRNNGLVLKQQNVSQQSLASELNERYHDGPGSDSMHGIVTRSNGYCFVDVSVVRLHELKFLTIVTLV